ncbi:MAG: 30S ribosomal protein S9 [Nanoarchaeota archaeon]|nr:30S ribosomal protein S9 [Nanoarchaeota archaeon]
MKAINVSGKRKSAIARAVIKKGTGKVRINKIPLDIYSDKIQRLRIKEPLILVGEISKKIDLGINVNGGGKSSQADAVRLVIGKALVGYDEKLKSILYDYDKHLLVADVRRKETRKPNRHGKARSKRQKSYR